MLRDTARVAQNRGGEAPVRVLMRTEQENNMNPLTRTACALCLGAGCIGSVHANVGAFRVVAISDAPTPVYPESITFGDLSIARIDGQGHVAFTTELSNLVLNSSLWMETEDGLELVGEPAAPAPGAPPGYVFYHFQPAYLAESGVVAVNALIADEDNTIAAAYTWSADVGFTPIVVPPFQMAPGEGEPFDHASINSINTHGEVVIRGEVSAGTGYWTNAGGSLSRVVVEGDDASAVAANAIFGDLHIGRVVLNDHGMLALSAELDHPLFGSFWSSWHGTAGALGVTAIESQQTPLGATTSFDGGFPIGVDLSINNASQVAFGQDFVEGGTPDLDGVWRVDNGTMETMGAVNHPGPYIGSVYTYADSLAAVINTDGQVYFTSRFDSAFISTNADTAIVRNGGADGPQIVVREGTSLLPLHDVQIDDLTYARFDLNRHGQVALVCELRGDDVDASSDYAIVATTRWGDPRIVVREGESLFLGLGDIRTIESLFMVTGNGPESGSRGALNDRGEIVANVHFTDGTEAFIVFLIPGLCRGDANGDLVVNFEDLEIVLDNWGAVGTPGFLEGDVNCDGRTNFSDLEWVLEHWGNDCL